MASWENTGYIAFASKPNQQDKAPQDREKNTNLILVAWGTATDKQYGVLDRKDIEGLLKGEYNFVQIKRSVK